MLATEKAVRTETYRLLLYVFPLVFSPARYQSVTCYVRLGASPLSPQCDVTTGRDGEEIRYDGHETGKEWHPQPIKKKFCLCDNLLDTGFCTGLV
jgi:hypothetical protein